MWREKGAPDPEFTDSLALDLSTVVPSLAGPKRPQDRVLLTGAKENFETALTKTLGDGTGTIRSAKVDGEDFELRDGHVMIAAIPSRSEEHTSELQSLMRISYAVFCLKKKNKA